MAWEWLNAIGVVAFAVSGAIAAMEERYDLLGVYVLGLVTAFGGGAIRNVLIGLPVSLLWEQGELFMLATLSCTFIFFLPQLWFQYIRHWTFFDAVGLAVFAVQGSLYALQAGHSFSAVIVAAMLTGCGGGMLRDVLAGRKPLVFREEVYAIWAIAGGVAAYFGAGSTVLGTYLLCFALVALRMLSVRYRWRLPKRQPESRTIKR